MLMLTCSLMKSFVPFGGFFSMPSDLKSPLGVSYQCPSRCHLCNEKCEQDMSAITKGGLASSVAEQYQSGLPSWLQMTEVRTNRAFDFGGLFFYFRDLIYQQLIARIRWQEDAVSTISQAIARCKARNEPKRFGASVRRDVWFTFLGPDCFSKKKIAISLADIFFGSKGTTICVDLRSHDEVSSYDVKLRGQTIVDRIAWELSKKPLSVVFLENIDEADLMVQHSLSQAVRTGKFSDSHGREVCISNTVFVTTLRFTKSTEISYYEKEIGNYSEESILRVKGWPIQIVIDRVVAKNARRGISNPVIYINKRKSFGISEMAKRPHKASNMHLDLNLPAEEVDILNTDCGNPESDIISTTNSKAWLEDFVELVDETVVFDFDKLAEKISHEISKCFQESVGSDCLLEIDRKVMEQVIAAACLFEDKEVEDWVKQVLSKGFAEAQKRYDLTSGYVVKLVAREGLSLDGEEPGVRLPSKVLVD